jgi:alpha-ketoglutarate-dependent taurine dioxygenase
MCTPSWDEGDLVLWDNQAVQHAGAEQTGGTQRTLRPAGCGEPPVLVADA